MAYTTSNGAVTVQRGIIKPYMDTQTPGIAYGSDPSVLYGTATFTYRGERKEPLSASASQREVSGQKYKKRRGGRLRTFVSKYISCCFHKSTKSYSVTQTPASAAIEDSHAADINKSTQDFQKDVYFQRLIADCGRNQCFTNIIFSENIVTVRNPSNQCELDNGAYREKKVKKPVKSPNNPRPQDHYLPCLTERKNSVQHHHQSYCLDAGDATDQKMANVPSKHSGLVSGAQKVENNPLSENDIPDSQSKTVGSDAENTPGSLVGELKNTLHAVSAGLNQSHDQENHAASRLSVRERSKQNLLKPRHQTKDLLRLNYPCRNRQLVQMMNEAPQNEFCYPIFSDLGVRMATLRNCREVQLSGFGREELAQAGWFFNRRILTTFCCGMEMPTTPMGTPNSIHLGLSPQCPFNLSLQSTAPDSSSDTQRLESPQGSMQTSGGEATLNFSVPVQATDDDCGHSDLTALSYGLNAEVGIPSATYQESVPSDRWVMYGAAAAVTQPDTSYYESLVTNRTQLPAEQWEPYPGNRQQYLAQQGPGDAAQNSQSQQTAAGQLALRGNAANPLGAARMLRDPVVEVGRQSPPVLDNFPPIDQLNIDGYFDSEHAPRFRQFGFPSVRVYTYDGWPVGHPQTPNMLSDAGFFYAGYGDSVLCYSCGIGVRNWLATDNAWIEHARFWPKCVFVRTIQGQHFIDVAREMTRNSRRPTYREVRLEANRRRQAAEGDSGEGEDAAIRSLRGDDNEIVDILCKMCYVREMNMILMPCRHLAVCSQCSDLIHSCPVCRADVASAMQANFA